MIRDPVVEEVREVGRKMAEQFDYDLHRLAEFLRARKQKKPATGTNEEIREGQLREQRKSR